MKDIFSNYDAFKLMVLTTSILGNMSDSKWEEDSKTIVSFIAKSYGLKDEIIKDYIHIITKEIVNLSLINDAQYNFFNSSKIDDDNVFAYDMKARTLILLQSFYNERTTNWLDYSHHNRYHPLVRFKELNEASRYGNLIACRQVGIQYALGIGVTQNLDQAILRLTQCAFWGDIESMYLLRQTYLMKNDQENYSICNEVISLADKYLISGVTLIKNENVSRRAIRIYALISSLFQDVIKPQQDMHQHIDYSFIEVLLLESIPYEEKLLFINNYASGQWRNITNNPREFKNSLFGFVKEN